jgi:hypothetical protein
MQLLLLLLRNSPILSPGLLLHNAAQGLHPLDLSGGSLLGHPRRLLLLRPVLVLRDLDRFFALVIGVVGYVLDQGVDEGVLKSKEKLDYPKFSLQTKRKIKLYTTNT